MDRVDLLGTGSRGRNPSRLLAKVLLALVVSVLSLELGLRVLQPRSTRVHRLLYQSTATVHWNRATTLADLLTLTGEGFRPHRARADFVSNSKGLRTAEYTMEKAPGTIRVLAMGDSFTYASGGVPYDALWHSQLQRGLQERTDQTVEVLNLGMAATGLDFQARLWDLEASQLDADMVVFAFFTGNDFWDGKGITASESALDRWSHRSLSVRLFRNLRLLRGLESMPESSAQPDFVFPKGGLKLGEIHPDLASVYQYDPMQARMPELPFLTTERGRIRLCRGRLLDQYMPWTEEALRGFRDRVTGSGIPLFVFIIPDRYQVEPELAARLIVDRKDDPALYDLERPQRLLAELLEREGIPYLDLLPALLAADQTLYHFQGTHLNADALEIAADLLVPLVARELDLAEPGTE